jgi:autotransporter family porin
MPSDVQLNGIMSTSLLEQDDGIEACGSGSETCIFTQLVSSQNQVTGSVGNVSLLDDEGNAVNNILTKNISRGGDEQVARATYNSKLLSEKSGQHGLYLGYGLTQIELKAQGSGSLILEAAAGKSGSATDLNAKLTDFVNDDGSLTYGDLRIQSQADNAVTLSNINNDYHGSTYVLSGSRLISGTDNALGNTNLLHLSAGSSVLQTSYSLNGHNQSIGSLYTGEHSIVDLGGGSLTITGADATDPSADLVSYTSAGTLTGAGQLNIGDPTLTRANLYHPVLNVSGDNLGLLANINIAVNGQVGIDSYGGLGSGQLTNDGILDLHLAGNGALTNSQLLGSGEVNKFGGGTLTMTLPQAGGFGGDITINGGAIVLNGDDNATGNSYAAANVNIGANGALIGLDHVIIDGEVNNAGRFYIGSAPGDSTVNQKTVTVGSYVGSGGHLIFNGKLEGDSSAINKLIITGDSSGTGYVTINNIGGLGAATVNGIEIIEVNGQSDAEFTNDRRIIAGAYDYSLVRSALNSNNWVLMSSELLRPEVGSYLANVFIANNMFNLRLHDRLGETQYTDLLTGEKKVTSMWLRHQYGYNKYKAGNGELAVKNNWNISQLGGDIAQWSSDGQNRLHIGLMAGHGRSENKSRSVLTNQSSDSTVKGYNYGIYGTWYDNDADKNGLYIDSWASWSDFDATVSGKDTSQKYGIKGLTASIESGYSFRSGKLGEFDVWLQPKAQLTWSDVKADDYVEDNMTRITTNHGNLQSRLGLRASLLSNNDAYSRTQHAGQIFVEANWLNNSKLYEIGINDEFNIGIDGAKNIGELKFGLEGNMAKNTSVWFNMSGQWGDHSYRNASVLVGGKYSF